MTGIPKGFLFGPRDTTAAAQQLPQLCRSYTNARPVPGWTYWPQAVLPPGTTQSRQAVLYNCIACSWRVRAPTWDAWEGQYVSLRYVLHRDHVLLQLWSCQVPVKRAGPVNEAYVSYWTSKDLWVATFSIWKLMYCKEWRQAGESYFSSGFLTADPICLLLVVNLASQMDHAAPSRSRDTRCSLLSPVNSHTRLTALYLHTESSASGKLWTEIYYRLDKFILPPSCFMSYNGDRKNGTRKRLLLLK